MCCSTIGRTVSTPLGPKGPTPPPGVVDIDHQAILKDWWRIGGEDRATNHDGAIMTVRRPRRHLHLLRKAKQVALAQHRSGLKTSKSSKHGDIHAKEMSL